MFSAMIASICRRCSGALMRIPDVYWGGTVALMPQPEMESEGGS
jgi:hypothetical protein